MKEYYLRFPSVLKNALKNNVINMPDNIEIEYDDITAFRAIRFIKDKKEVLEKRDFLSQIDLKMTGDKNFLKYSEDDVDNYGTSVYDDKEELVLGFKLPKKNKGIAIGLVKKECGPVSRSDEDSHILWFLYDGASPEKYFEVVEYYEEVDRGKKYRTIEL